MIALVLFSWPRLLGEQAREKFLTLLSNSRSYCADLPRPRCLLHRDDSDRHFLRGQLPVLFQQNTSPERACVVNT